MSESGYEGGYEGGDSGVETVEANETTEITEVPGNLTEGEPGEKGNPEKVDSREADNVEKTENEETDKMEDPQEEEKRMDLNNPDLTETEREAIKTEINEKSEYSSDVNDHISSVEELEVYQKAGLKEETVGGRTCLIRTDINFDYVDPVSQKTNRELMEAGRAPYDEKTGEQIELHHIGQDYESPLAELTTTSEHDLESKKLHTKQTESWRGDSKKNNHYNNTQRPNHWRSRAKGE